MTDILGQLICTCARFMLILNCFRSFWVNFNRVFAQVKLMSIAFIESFIYRFFCFDLFSVETFIDRCIFSFTYVQNVCY